MTRWARKAQETKVPHRASNWKELQRKRTDATVTSPIEQFENGKETCNQVDMIRSQAIKKDIRRENRRLKRQRRKESNKVCFHCRVPGHGMADCPTLQNDTEQGTGVCFKCGSTEHKSATCTAKIKPGQEFSFAKCFVCGESGHLSNSCPDNPRGLYPDGGCCKLCGSVEHYKRDCPEREIHDEIKLYHNKNPDGKRTHISVDDEVTLYEDEKIPQKTLTVKKRKIVTF